jgi:hypothetical protein
MIKNELLTANARRFETTMKELPKCPRCGTGNLLVHREIEGPELRCIQCGASASPRLIIEAQLAKAS